MDIKEWYRKNAERSDITTNLVHLTKSTEMEGERVEAVDVLIKILEEKKLIGSTTKSGFIVGNRRAVCFQESPLYSLTQNIYYEERLVEENKLINQRYVGVGIVFNKPFVYKKGGRPVIYDKTTEAKQYLPYNKWWRIVNYDLSKNDKIIDWTHEREWRVPDDLEFELDDISIVVPNEKLYKYIINKFKDKGIDIINEVKSIGNLADLFF